MIKHDLIEIIAEKANLTKQSAEAAINAYNEAIVTAISRNESVKIVGFGTYEIKYRAPRIGKNPQTGETVSIPATKIPAFRPGKLLKDAVKNNTVE